MIDKACAAYSVSIFMAGNIELAKQICREFCDKEGLCVTVTPTTYIYTGGQEEGFVIGLINYPRFPADAGMIFAALCSKRTKLHRRSVKEQRA